MEHIDLIREAKELPHQARSKIGNRQTATSSGSADDDSESNTDTDSYPEEQPTYTKLEEIDLLSSIGRDIGVDLEKYVQPVPDVVAMEALDPIHSSTRSSVPTSNMTKDDMQDTNKLLDRDLPEASGADTKKKEKMVRNQAKRRQQQQQQQQQLQQLRAANPQKRPDKRRADADNGPGILIITLYYYIYNTYNNVYVICNNIYINNISVTLSQMKIEYFSLLSKYRVIQVSRTLAVLLPIS